MAITFGEPPKNVPEAIRVMVEAAKQEMLVQHQRSEALLAVAKSLKLKTIEWKR